MIKGSLKGDVNEAEAYIEFVMENLMLSSFHCTSHILGIFINGEIDGVKNSS